MVYKKVYGYINDPIDTRDFLNKRVLSITLRLSDRCNFSCNYCTYYDNSKKSIEFDKLKIVLEDIIKNISGTNKYDSINWYIHGGEPTVYPKFIEAMLYISSTQQEYNLKYDIEIQTNSSFKKLEKFAPLIGKNIKFVCSYQHHQNTPEQFKSFCTFMLKNKMFAGVDLILENKDPDKIIEIYYWLEAQKEIYNISYNIQTNTVDGVSFDKIDPKYQIFKNKKISEQILVEYQNGKKEIFDYDVFSTNGMNNFKLMKCQVGRQSIIMDVTYSDTVKFYKCFSDILYTKNKPFLELPLDKFNGIHLIKHLKPTLCIHPKCICEIFIPKYDRKLKEAEICI